MKPFLADGLISQITEANAVTLIAGSTSANVQLFTSGTPTTAVVSNPGNIPAWVALGSSSVAATVGSGTLVAPGASVVLSLGKLKLSGRYHGGWRHCASNCCWFVKFLANQPERKTPTFWQADLSQICGHFCFW
jgi:hypothetical protein